MTVGVGSGSGSASDSEEFGFSTSEEEGVPPLLEEDELAVVSEEETGVSISALEEASWEEAVVGSLEVVAAGREELPPTGELSPLPPQALRPSARKANSPVRAFLSIIC